MFCFSIIRKLLKPLLHDCCSVGLNSYISTEASDKGLADHLTNFTHSRVSYTPALRNAPPQSLGNIYVFANGIKGPGPLGFQANVAYLEDHPIFMCLQTESKELGLWVFRQALRTANVGDIAYSPLWRIQATTWKDPSRAEFLTSLAQITSG